MLRAAIREYVKAVESFVAATGDNLADTLSWIGLGLAYTSIGDFAGAIASFKVGIEKNPGDIWFWKALGDA